jgi:antitoxin (DNA-binding transcriptional repressor) of toxin-antitoxin stability system
MQTIPIEFLEAMDPQIARIAEQGEKVVLTRAGRPILDLVPHQRRGGLDVEAGRKFLRGQPSGKLFTSIAADFDAALPEDILTKTQPSADAGQ